jgi:type IV pilus assembly protein PilO
MAWYNPTDPQQRNYMVVGLVVLLLIVPFRMYILTPRQGANATVRTRVEALAEQNRRAGILAARGGGDLQERLALYERHVAQLEELIPAREEVAILLDDIQSRARAVNVDVKTLVPEPAQPGEFYDRTAYDMSVVGEYHAVGRFLTEIASLSRIVTPVQVDVQTYGAPREYPEMVSPVIANFRIETFVLPDRTNQPATEVGA